MAMNQVNLIGNVGKDPEIITFNNGDKIARITLATSEYWKDKTTGEKKSVTEWHNVVFSGGVVKIVESYVSKGAKIAVQDAKLKTRSWESNNGEKRSTTEVHSRTVHLLSSMKTTEAQNPQTDSFVAEGDDLPF